MNRVKVSVIVPVYNTADFLEESLACLTGQTLREIEIIVVDDGSTDDSPHIIRRAAEADARITSIRQENAGQSAARNAGLATARGEYVYFMDSDDLLDADALECCYYKCVRENLDAALFDADIFGEAGCFDPDYYHRTGRLEDRVYSGPELFGLMQDRKAHRASVCLYLARREYMERIGLRFHEGIIHEDELFSLLLCLRAERAGIIRRPFFKRRFRADSTMTARFSMRNMQGYFTVADEAKKFASGCGSPSVRKQVRRFVNGMLNAAARKAWSLPAPDRIKVLAKCFGRMNPYTVAVLLIKRPLGKLKLR